MKVKDRWIIARGIPFHLWCSETFEYICSEFGKFKEVQVVNSHSKDVTTLKLHVGDCNPKLVRNIIPPLDYGLAYPISVSFAESMEDQQSRQRCSVEEDGVLSGQMAEVAGEGWKTKKKKTRSRSRGSSLDKSGETVNSHSFHLHGNHKRLNSCVRRAGIVSLYEDTNINFVETEEVGRPKNAAIINSVQSKVPILQSQFANLSMDAGNSLEVKETVQLSHV